MAERTGKRILVVEDDVDLAWITKEILEGQGYEVELARDGAEALDRLEVHAYDLILTDLMMPGMDGFDLLARLRAERPRLPVLAISAIPAYVSAAVAAGARAALQKPFDAEALMAQVRALVEGMPPAPAPVAADRYEGERVAVLQEMGLEVMDPTEGMSRFCERVARLYDLPICLVSLITQARQHWLASCGLPEDLERAGGVPRGDSFCTHAVAGRTALVVQNATAHPYFRENRLVRTRGLRFYAGAPIFSREGHALGTLCVLDFAPHAFGHFDLELLAVLSTRVAGELEWQAHLTSADEPEASYVYLARYDPELELLGRGAFTEALQVQMSRAVARGVPATLVAVALEPQGRTQAAQRLAEAFPADLLGRLQRDRVGLVAYGLSPEEAGAGVEAALPSAAWVTVDLRGRLGAASTALRDAEVQLSDLQAARPMGPDAAEPL